MKMRYNMYLVSKVSPEDLYNINDSYFLLFFQNALTVVTVLYLIKAPVMTIMCVNVIMDIFQMALIV